MWRPVLDGAQLDAARSALASIVERQLDLPPSPGREACSLMDGDAGRAVFLSYVGAATADPRATEHAARLLANAVDQLEHASDLPTFHRGFTGCAWALAHVGAACGLDADTSDIDEALVEMIAARPAWLEFEWLRGAAGFTIYALERLPATTPLLRALVDYFEAVAERVGSHVRWRMANPEEAVRFADGTFALGPAHGAAGALAALAGIAAAGIEVDRVRALVDGTLAWLASQHRDGAAFPSYAGDTQSWPGWCSGDPGIAGTLDAAGRALARPDVVELAVTTGRNVVRSIVTADLGASLCHGWAGVAHICSRLHHATADADFAGAARIAFARMLAVAGDGDDSLLTGSAGVGLALLSATTSTEPRWDRALYLSYA